jgi:DNA mismatch repair protein MSH3
VSLSEKVNGDAHVIEVVDDDEDGFAVVEDPLVVKKSKTSGYFGKAASISLGDGSNDSTPTLDGQPEAGPSHRPSKPRAAMAAPTYLQDYRLPRAAMTSTLEQDGAFGTFSYPSASQTRPSVQRTPAQQTQHEKWHRKVVGGNLIPRRRSLALDDAAAAEARRQINGVDHEDAEGLETPPVEEVQDSDDERQKQAEQVGSGLAAKYGAKVDVKGKGKATTTRKKRDEEVGPSGQTYTPLERQYMEIHAKYPDVLLLMEGE